MDITQSELDILREAFPNGVVVVDLETTGLSPLVDKIIEISAIKVTPEAVNTFDQLVNPNTEIPQTTIDIHGITNQAVADSPEIKRVLPQFLDFLGDLPMIAHNARFDVGFLVFDMHQLKLPLPAGKIYCSCKFSREVFKDMPNHRLSTLAFELKIDLVDHHRALADARASLRVFAKALLKQKSESKINLHAAYQFKFKDFCRNQEMDIPDHLRGLIKKLESQQVVDIKYSGGSMKNKFRPIRPVAFLPMPDGNVLYAHCLTSNIYKSFSLKKITQFKELNAAEIRERLALLDK